MLTHFYSPHTTSVDNEAGRASGHADVPLSDLGRRLARELGQHYATAAIDAVFCSDLQLQLLLLISRSQVVIFLLCWICGSVSAIMVT